MGLSTIGSIDKEASFKFLFNSHGWFPVRHQGDKQKIQLQKFQMAKSPRGINVAFDKKKKSSESQTSIASHRDLQL